MKRLGILTLGCAAALTIACAGEPRDETARLGDDTSVMDDSNASAVGTSGQFETRGASATSTRQFVHDMLRDGAIEVQLGKMAAERGSSEEVKQFGQRMVQDHTKAGEQLRQIASKYNLEMSDAADVEHKAAIDRLSSLKGAEFDRAYMAQMVQQHERAVKMAQSRARGDNRNTTASGTQDRPAATAGAPERDAGAQAGNIRPGEQAQARPEGTTGENPQGLDAAVSGWASQTLPILEQHLEQAKAIQGKVGDPGSGANR